MEIEVINQLAIQVTWSPPNMSNCTDVDEYRISCYFYSSCSYTYTRQTTSTSIILLIGSYLSHCDYTCCVTGSNSAGISLEECALKREFSRWICIIIIVFIARPTPPRNVTVSLIHPTLLQIEWIEPEKINGDFDLYSVVCGTQTSDIYSITETAVNMTGLNVFTRYECCVTAQTYTYLYDNPFKSSPSCVNATTAPGTYVECVNVQ